MNNSIFQQFGNRGQNGFFQMIRQFNEFKNNFKGDPKAEVEQLLKNGKINQSQLNQLQSAASQFLQILNSK